MAENERKNLDKADQLIVDILEKAGKPLTTYQIAKQAGISWATVTIHCQKLKYMRIIDSSVEESKIGSKKILWWVRK